MWETWKRCLLDASKLRLLTKMPRISDFNWTIRRNWQSLETVVTIKEHEETSKPACGLIGSICQKSERADTDDTFPIDGIAVLAWEVILFTLHLKIATTACKAYILLNSLKLECIVVIYWLSFFPNSDYTEARDNALCIITSVLSATNLGNYKSLHPTPLYS